MVQEDVEYMNRLDNTGSITLYTGAMFSGKTTALLHLKTILSKLRAAYIVMKPAIDTRYNQSGESPAIVSHNQDRFKALPTEKGALINLYPEDYWRATHILIDEAHIFDPESLVDFCKKAADKDSKHVIIAAVNHGTTGEPVFAGINKLVPLADRVHRLRAPCTICGRDAPFTIRTTPVTNNNWVGGAEMYASLCRFHWVQLDITQDTVNAPLPVCGSGQALFGGSQSPEKFSEPKNTAKTNARVKGRPVEAIIDAGAVYSMISENMMQKLELSDELIPSNEESINVFRGRGRELGYYQSWKCKWGI